MHIYNCEVVCVPLTPESVVKEFAKRVLERYGNVVKSVVLVGSGARGKLSPKSDIDVLVIIDDTSELLTNEASVKALDNDLNKIAKEISKKLSVHLMTVTDFVKDASSGDPIVYNFLKEGKPVFDVGFFTPWKKLLRLGRVRWTREAVEKLMESSSERVVDAEAMKLFIICKLCYGAIVESTQAVLMELGLEPKAPHELYKAVEKHLVKDGFLEEEYAEWLREIVELRKRVEHEGLGEIDGEDIDKWIGRARRYVKAVSKLLTDFKLVKRELIIEELYERMLKTVSKALAHVHRLEGVEKLERHLGLGLKEAFKRDFIDTGLVSESYLDLFNKLEELYNDVVKERDFKEKVRKLEGLEEEELTELLNRVKDFEDEMKEITTKVMQIAKSSEEPERGNRCAQSLKCV
jgi:uncharacterized protein (UPF0332 family)/predicted nucleotidyltransferase